MSFDDEEYFSGRESDPPQGDPVRARLKWFNAPKGFGFVVPENRDVDAFLHITVLQEAGVQTLKEGSEILCHIDYGQKGAHVTHIVEVLDSGCLRDKNPIPDSVATIQISGTVKWYKPEKGFGFIMADDGLKDVFVHKTCLDRLGLETIEPGQRVIITVRTVAKGREVVELALSE